MLEFITKRTEMSTAQYRAGTRVCVLNNLERESLSRCLPRYIRSRGLVIIHPD